MKRSVILLATVFPLSCASLPDNAPKEFHEAKAAIGEMNDLDADETMPNTAEFAEETFENSVEMLESARENDSSENLANAREKAATARDHAKKVTRIHNDVIRWDKDRNQFSDALARLDGETLGTTEPTSGLARLSGTEIVSTVAFFDTNSAENPTLVENELDSLIKLIEQVPSGTLTLAGHADVRGDESYNQMLAEKRAKKIASIMRDKGIEGISIEIESMGETGSIFETETDKAKLQLDRKVVARLTL